MHERVALSLDLLHLSLQSFSHPLYDWYCSTSLSFSNSIILASSDISIKQTKTYLYQELERHSRPRTLMCSLYTERERERCRLQQIKIYIICRSVFEFVLGLIWRKFWSIPPSKSSSRSIDICNNNADWGTPPAAWSSWLQTYEYYSLVRTFSCYSYDCDLDWYWHLWFCSIIWIGLDSDKAFR